MNPVFIIAIASVVMVGVMVPSIFAEPELFVEDLVVEKYISDLCCMITTMTFVDDDILILQKKDGLIRLIQDGSLQEKPVLDVNVNSIGEKGLLGITSVNSSVYVYFTEAKEDGEKSLGNKIYKYDWNGYSLTNPILLNELPSNISHNGGAMVTGLDNQVYAVIGDTGKYGPLQNKLLENLFPPNTPDYMDTSVILRVDPEGPYQAIGIRNSFGLAIDPITGNLWATENGDDNFDEINLISDKFNSGWNKIMGPVTESELVSLPDYEDYVYGDPIFTWEKVVAPTGLTFGKFKEISNYDNSLFVGDCNTGNLYKFELNSDRNGFEFSSSFLQDNIIHKNESMDELIIGTGFGCITDIERGSDGFLYVVSLSEGVIFRIIPSIISENMINPNNGGGCLIATATYGSELAPQVQQLRELRDNQLLQTESGTAFMGMFNNIYYSFSPTIADMEREHPMFKEAVKLVITPMISTLSLMENAESESEVLSIGISVIMLNLGMYLGVPSMVVIGIKKKF